jgi:hypothetical protein
MTGTVGGWPNAGFGTGSSPWTYTPQLSGRLEVRVQGPVGRALNQATAFRVNYGTGTAPQTNATGGTPVPYTQSFEDALQLPKMQPVHMVGIINNLALGTTYWFDLAVVTSVVSARVSFGTDGTTGPAVPMGITWQEL